MRICFTILGAGVALAAAGMIVSATSAGLVTAATPANAAVVAGGGAGAGVPAAISDAGTANEPASAEPAPAARSAFDFTLTAIDGKPMPLSQYRGKVLLLVNTASFCGFTPQYEGLQKLQDRYAEQGFTVLGVPSGDFREQEYDDNGKIREFCEVNFGITFPLAEKSVVKGAQAIPLYRWVKTRITRNNEPEWNFHKFLIGRDGAVIAGYKSAITPDDAELNAAIRKALVA